MPAPPETPTGPHFGTWLACADGRSHYHLGGRALCGCGAAPTGPAYAPPTLNRAMTVLAPHCGDCRERNEARWAEGGGT